MIAMNYIKDELCSRPEPVDLPAAMIEAMAWAVMRVMRVRRGV
jgi:hypothetical protein